ncbi:peptidoglycan editing factor PgeF [Aliiglaciecola litoralis]|uniref:Purine nucleoside phosphorylase n=1 Tax=Aliiglaciecola litoralis TaxID=582857 RepID=A0ABP3WWJ9_9ALTE
MTDTTCSGVLAPDWSLPDGIAAFYTCRQGGSSLAPFDAFNLALHVGDDPMDVAANRALLPNSDRIAWLNQVHSARCVPISQDYFLSLEPAKADASISREKHLVCAVMTADCLPILIASKDASCVAAVHAGWRGLANGVLQNTLAALPCEPSNLSIWVGPHISQSHFQVGQEVKQALAQYASAFVKDAEAGKFRCDLFQIVQAICLHSGITDITNSDICTYANHQLFFSHRHAQHHQQQRTGRIVSGIYLR